MLKVHGTKNTFYIVDQLVKDYKGRAIHLCKDGTHGVLYVLNSDHALAKMRIFNADGSEAEMCGNGLRCFARYILEKEKVEEGLIETLCETYAVKYIKDFYGQVGISLVLSPIKTFANTEALEYSKKTDRSFDYYRVSNPHVVSEVDSILSDEALIAMGIKAQEVFKLGVNVNLYKILSKNKIYVKTFERGVGITPSCGTGMTASSVAYGIKYNLFDQTIEVYNDGGLILCEVKKEKENYKVIFTGNATYIGKYENGKLIKTYEDEGKSYEEFFNQSRNYVK